MKSTPAYVFVDDGYPEASDYDNNFIGYDPAIRGSCERALLEADQRIAKPGVLNFLFPKSRCA